jgi:cell division protein FtsX
MNRVRGIVFAVLFAALVLFAYQNWIYPTPPLQFLFYTFPLIPHSLLIFSCLLIGFVAGWLAHFLKIRRVARAKAFNQGELS